jgi:hypothetical protein
MKGIKKKAGAAPPPVEDAAAATPFFARFLEDQHADDDEAKVTERGGRAPFTYKERAAAKSDTTKTKATKPKAGGVTKTKAATAVTLKYPSDRDEWVLYPYHVEAASIKGSTRQTLKYPSDRDEVDGYVPVYINAADAPKSASAKPKKDAKVALTTKAADIDNVAS